MRELAAVVGSLVTAALFLVSPVVAQDCMVETEPNDALEAAVPATGPACATGELTQEDGVDHILLWTIGPDEAAQRWDLAISSAEGSPAILAVSKVTSDPAAPTLSVEPNIVEVRTEFGAAGPNSLTDLWLAPGRYLLSVGPGGPWTGTPKTYRVEIGLGSPLPASADQEPNDDAATGTPVADAFEVSGDAAATDDYFAWQIVDAVGPGLWTIEAESAMGAALAVTISDADGAVEGDIRTMPDGLARLPDLRLPAGIHTIRVTGTSEPERPYVVRAYREDVSTADPEPNDDPAHALPIAPGELRSGRLARYADWDAYRLTVDERLGATLIDARLIVQSGPPRRLCLSLLTPSDRGLGEAIQELTCDDGPTGATLEGLLLQPGAYQLVVSGSDSLVDPYYLRVDASVPPQPGFELEPNDTPAMATSMQAGETMRGRLDNSDHFRVHVEGQPQLWDVEARGPDARLLWVRTDGYAQGLGSDPDGTGERSVITDAYLIPGDHWFRVDGTGEYELTLTALGPPLPGGEREPNDALAFANTLHMGGSVTGRRRSVADRDVYRFSLAGPEHVRLTLEPPPDGTVRLYPSGDTAALTSFRESPSPGQPAELDLVLPAGDHAVEVDSPVSQERYRLSLQRLDPFDLAIDQEPNDEAVAARSMPASLRAAGTTEAGDDADWYRLEPLPAAGELAIRVEGEVDALTLDDGALETALVADADGATFRTPPLPAGASVALGIRARGPYTFAVDPGTTGLVAAAEPIVTDLPVQLTLEMQASEVAAFEEAGQRVPGQLSIVNDGATDLALRLDAVTSDPDWTIRMDSADVSVAPGGSAEVPLSVVAPAQAWAGQTVRASIRARTDTGLATTSAELTPRAGAPLVEPFRWWAVPDELLGGLDAAATGLGAVPLVSIDAAAEAAVHDGIVALGAGMVANVALPQTLTVDLAGGEPVPIAGTILDPTAGLGAVAGTVRDFELLLSLDGVTYESVLSGELTGALTDQAFLLPETVPARFAQLRIGSVYPGTSELRLGEWKVVATPGWTPSTEPFNVADPAIGGHVAWFDPQVGDWTALDAMLTPDASTPWLLGFDPEKTSTASWAIGFQDGRAAQVTSLEWVDPPGTRPELHLPQVELAISLDGPSGPWTPLGTWSLERDASGVVAPFPLAEPTWIRYLRMSAPLAEPINGTFEMPDAIRVLEAPTSDTYRSVAGEWGYGMRVGPHEWQQPVPGSAACVAEAGDDGDGSAAVLEPGAPVAGCVMRGTINDTYTFTVPGSQQSVRLTVSGRPTVGVGLTLLDEAGVEVPMLTASSDVPGAVEHIAAVTPGTTYRLAVDQPPFSVVALFDSSGSVGPYIPIMTSALRSYLGGIVTGEEALQLFDLEGPPLPDEFTDDPWLILNALDAQAGSLTGSSSAEIGLIDALDALAAREGTRAILLMTDAETGSFDRQAELWRWLGLVRPRVFTIQVGGCCLPQIDERLMQDWAAVGAGSYDIARAGGDIERAFDRMATWLRRPAEYGLTMAFSADPPPEPEPGSLRVVSDPNAVPPDGEDEDARAARAEADVAVEIVLDTSTSMLDRLGRRPRIDVAKRVLAKLVAEHIDPGTPVALRVFRQVPRSCESELAVPLSPLDPAVMGTTIAAISIERSIGTPLAAAIEAVGQDLAAIAGPRIVIVVSDGQESCGGDPEAAVQSLVDQGFDVTVNVVGLDLDRKSRKRIARLANVGGGEYFDARDPAGLEEALKGALGAPYVVLDASGVEVGRGTVDGPSIELPPGIYRIMMAGAAAALDAVVLESGERETVTVAAPPAGT